MDFEDYDDQYGEIENGNMDDIEELDDDDDYGRGDAPLYDDDDYSYDDDDSEESYDYSE